MNTQKIVSWEILTPQHYPSLHPNMLTERGELRQRRVSIDGEPAQPCTVKFDRSYVRYFIKKRVIGALNLDSFDDLSEIFLQAK